MERFDSFLGVVTGRNHSGVYITSKNGESAYSYGGNIPIGSKVFCTVLREAREKLYPRVSIDSVINYGMLEA